MGIVFGILKVLAYIFGGIVSLAAIIGLICLVVFLVRQIWFANGVFVDSPKDNLRMPTIMNRGDWIKIIPQVYFESENKQDKDFIQCWILSCLPGSIYIKELTLETILPNKAVFHAECNMNLQGAFKAGVQSSERKVDLYLEKGSLCIGEKTLITGKVSFGTNYLIWFARRFETEVNGFIVKAESKWGDFDVSEV